jgi:hypothetical protein
MKTENDYWTKEAIIARQLAIINKPRPPKPKPSAEERAEKTWTQPLSNVLRTNAQSNQRALERAEEELREAEARREREQHRQIAEMVNHAAIEQAYALRQWEALAARRYDPLGSWGAPNYKTNPDD